MIKKLNGDDLLIRPFGPLIFKRRLPKNLMDKFNKHSDEVSKNKPRTDWDSTYLPHGVSEKYYHPISIFDDKYKSVVFSQLFPMIFVHYIDRCTIEQLEYEYIIQL